MAAIEARTNGRISLNPGTFYRALDRLLSQGLLQAGERRVGTSHRRVFKLSRLGARVAAGEARRLADQVSAARVRRLLSRDWRPLMRRQPFLSCAVGLYATLLVLCPPRFRAAYGADMTALFRAGASARGGEAAVRRWSLLAWPASPISLRSGSPAAWRVFARRAVPFPVIPRPEVIPCSPKP